MQRIIVLGAGFAGLWSAVGAARALDEHGIGRDRIEVIVVNATPWHSIRVRNYEAELSGTRVALEDIFEPIGVGLVVAEITGLSVTDRTITYAAADGFSQLTYDRMVFALGSRLIRPPIPGLREHAFDVERTTPRRCSARTSLGWPVSHGRSNGNGAGIGAGLNEIEVAAEIRAGSAPAWRTIRKPALA